MNNYKIKVKDEAESKEVQELFFELGYVWADTKCQTPMKFTTSCIYSGFEDGELCRDYYDENPNHQELTLPQLRDLVVLKRNDSRDANVNQGGEIPCLYDLYLTADKELYFYHCGKGKWLLSNLNHDEDYYATLKPIEKPQPQDPALISGAEAKLAWAKGEDLQIDTGSGFEDLTDNYYLAVFDRESNKFRLKPRTVKLEIEVPLPFKPNSEDEFKNAYRIQVGNKQIFWKTEADFLEATSQIQKILEHSK